jgi:hypothetical protein
MKSLSRILSAAGLASDWSGRFPGARSRPASAWAGFAGSHRGGQGNSDDEDASAMAMRRRS